MRPVKTIRIPKGDEVWYYPEKACALQPCSRHFSGVKRFPDVCEFLHFAGSLDEDRHPKYLCSGPDGDDANGTTE